MDISRPDSTLTELLIDEVLMDRMVRAVERVSDRLQRMQFTSSSLERTYAPTI
jgi:hypothetical protein